MSWNTLLAACLPSRCHACGEWADGPAASGRFPPLCRRCAAALVEAPGACLLEGRLVLRWAFAPDAVVRSLIKALKYSGRDGALPLLAAALCRRLDRDPPPRPWTFVPVPLPLPRRLARGFNQAELLAAALRARAAEGELLCALARRPLAGRQAGRSRRERWRRSADEFRCRRALPATGSLILIDDLATTGATLLACRAALGEAVADRLSALVLTRIPPPGDSLDSSNRP